MMNFRIEQSVDKLLIGMKIENSFSDDKTFSLWNTFMPAKDSILNKTSSDLFSVQLYPKDFFKNFNPGAKFYKWAAAEVSYVENIPQNMETITIPSGIYAVFSYTGKADDAAKYFEWIYNVWFKEHNYELDQRYHFEILGEKYKHNQPDSEEEIWIPVRNKL